MERGGRAIFRRIKRKRNPGLFQGQTMNESLTMSKGINLAFLDEVFESLSSDNVEVVTSLIRHTFADKTLFLITHLDSLPLSNTKILQVEKVNGLSSYNLL